jgi:hypothetical protein
MAPRRTDDRTVHAVRERIAEIELARSRWLHPTEADLAMIRDTTDLPATIVERKDLLAPGVER